MFGDKEINSLIDCWLLEEAVGRIANLLPTEQMLDTHLANLPVALVVPVRLVELVQDLGLMVRLERVDIVPEDTDPVVAGDTMAAVALTAQDPAVDQVGLLQDTYPQVSQIQEMGLLTFLGWRCRRLYLRLAHRAATPRMRQPSFRPELPHTALLKAPLVLQRQRQPCFQHKRQHRRHQWLRRRPRRWFQQQGPRFPQHWYRLSIRQPIPRLLQRRVQLRYPPQSLQRPPQLHPP